MAAAVAVAVVEVGKMVAEAVGTRSLVVLMGVGAVVAVEVSILLVLPLIE